MFFLRDSFWYVLELELLLFSSISYHHKHFAIISRFSQKIFSPRNSKEKRNLKTKKRIFPKYFPKINTNLVERKIN